MKVLENKALYNERVREPKHQETKALENESSNERKCQGMKGNKRVAE